MNDIDKMVDGVFDGVLAEPAAPSPAFSADMDDDTRASTLTALSMAPAEDIDPNDFFETGQLDEAASQIGIEPAIAGFEFEWNWNMDPLQRASRLADVSFRNNMAAIVDGFSDRAVKEPVVDPVKAGEDIFLARERRKSNDR